MQIEDSTLHVFKECIIASHVWDLVNIASLYQCFTDPNPASWIDGGKQKLTADGFNLFAIILSFLWFNRNQVKHGEACFLPERLLYMSKEIIS